MADLSVLWSDEARRTSKHIADYIQSEWGQKSVLEFRNKIDILLELLSNNKKLCPKSKSQKSLRKCTLTKQTSLVYEIRKKKIYLVTFIDNRSDHTY